MNIDLKRLARSHRLRLLTFKVGRVLVFPFALVFVGLLSLSNLFFPVRFYPIGRVWSFGWICIFPDRLIRNWQIEPPAPSIKHIILMHSPGNRVLMDMWKRRLTVVESRFVGVLVELAAPILRRTSCFRYEDSNVSGGYFSLYSPQRNGKFFAPSLSFLPEEERKGREWLESVGLRKGDWWVCFHNRDDAYYSSQYQTARNCSIESYIQAVEHVADLGGFAFRMGATAEVPIPENTNDKIIDYVSSHRSELLDIYLLSKCRFFLGNTSGTFAGAMIFNRPFAMANALSVFEKISLSSQDLWIPKHVRRIDDHMLLGFDECRRLSNTLGYEAWRKLMSTGQSQGLEFVENSEAEILDVTLDMIDQINGVEPDPEMSERVRDFARIYKGKDPDQFHKISPRFLERWKSLAPELW